MKKLLLVLLPISISFALLSGTVQAKKVNDETEIGGLKREIERWESSFNQVSPPKLKVMCRKELKKLYEDLIAKIREKRDSLKRVLSLSDGEEAIGDKKRIQTAEIEIKDIEGKQQANEKELTALQAGVDRVNDSGSFPPPPMEMDKTLLSGIVVDSDEKPLRNISIRIESEKTGQRYSYTTDPTGEFSFPNLPDGNYKLIAEGDDFNKKEKASLRFDSGKTRPLTIELIRKTASLPVRAIFSRNTPLPNVKLTLSQSVDGGKKDFTPVLTDANGMHTFAKLNVGKYKLKAEIDGYKSAEDEVDLRAGENDEVKTVRMERTHAAVWLKIVDKGNKSEQPPVKIQVCKKANCRKANGELIPVTFQLSYHKGIYEIDGLDKDIYQFMVSSAGFAEYSFELAMDAGEIREDIEIGLEKLSEGPYYRGIVGLQQLGNVSHPPEQKVFLDLFFSSGLGKAVNPGFRVWGQVQTGSVQSLGNASIKTTVDSFQNNILQKSASGIFDSVEFLVGAQRFLREFPFAGARIRANLVGAFGAISPQIPENEVTAKIFNYTEAAKTRFSLSDNVCSTPDAANCKSYISLIPKDRDRFFRQFYAGARLETVYHEPSSTNPPAILDIMFGRNEALTGGTFKGLVMRLDGFFPMSFIQGSGDTAATRFIYLFGTANLRLNRPKVSDPLILQRVTDKTIAVNDPKLLVLPIAPDDRDSYRFGVGINFLDLIKKALDH